MAAEKVTYPLRLSRELRDFLRAKAEQEQLSFNALLVNSLVRYWRWAPRRVVAHAVVDQVEQADCVGGRGSRGRPPGRYPDSPRNAPCPCGSGLKYKRCCARDAA
jgi:uncharacterized protein YecA (UPF0149 family)